MNAFDYIVNVTEADFDYQVIAFSQQRPVVVDFWAEWCAPCRVIGPLLERLAQDARGAFRLAKVNIDENPKLAKRYEIYSIPAVKAFQNGRPVAEFVGVIPEPQLRNFIGNLVPDETKLALEKGQGLLSMRQIQAAEETFREILEKRPGYPPALLGLSKSQLLQGKHQEAHHILRAFPTSKESTAAESLRPLADALQNIQALFAEDDPLEAAYKRALDLIRRGNTPAAMDGILDILREDRRFRSGEAHRIMLAIFELLGDEDPLVDEYRRELANILF